MPADTHLTLRSTIWLVYRIVTRYGIATLSGRFEGWMRKNELFRGYTPGNFASHTVLAAVVKFGG